MIAEAQDYCLSAPHLVINPDLAVMITAPAFNLIGYDLRDVFEPRQCRR